jgi:hypothetical protein
MVGKYKLPLLGMTGKINSILSNDELTLLIWQESTGLIYIFKKILQIWVYFTSYSPSIASSSMNSITLNNNGTIAIF